MFSSRVALNASAKAKLVSTKWDVAVNEKFEIRVNGKVKKASYSYVSQNKKVAKVNSKGVVTGLVAGKAKIKVTQKLKGKKTVVGTFNLTVKKAKVHNNTELVPGFNNQVGLYEKHPLTVYFGDYMSYMNEKATYTAISNDIKKLTLTNKNKNTFLVKSVNGTGSVSITFKETYKGKTRTVGTMKFKLYSPQYFGENSVKLSKGETLQVSPSFVEAYKVAYSIENAEPDPNDWSAEQSGVDCITCSKSDDSWYSEIKGVSDGTVFVYLYAYNYNTEKWETTSFANFEITVYSVSTADKIVTKMNYGAEVGEMEWIEDSADDPTQFMVGDTKVLSVYQEPYNYTGEIKVTSSDPSVVQVEEFKKASAAGVKNDDFDVDPSFAGRLFLTPVGVGTATITIEANGFKEEHYVVVKDNTINTGDDDLGWYCTVKLDKAIPYDQDADEEILASDFLLSSSDGFLEYSATGYEFYTDSDNKYIKAVQFKLQPNWGMICETDKKEVSTTLKVSYQGQDLGSYSVTARYTGSNSDSNDDYDDDYDDLW